MAKDPKIDELGRIPLFADLDRKHLERISQLCTGVSLPAGRVLCKQGEPGSEFFVIEEGTVAVEVDGRQVATLGAGDFFGELALLDGKERNATVTAQTDLQLLVLSRAEFSGLMATEPAVAVRMLPAVGARLRAGTGSATERPPVV